MAESSMGARYVQRLEERLGNRYSPHTRVAFRGHAWHFLKVAGVKPEYSRDDVLRFIDRLIGEGYRPQSITTITAGVKALFWACDLTWPLDRRDLHLGLPEREADGPVMDTPSILALIQKTPEMTPLVRACIALSTIWGLRASEIMEVISAGHRGQTLEVATAKGGRIRSHQIPEVLVPVFTLPAHPIGRAAVTVLFSRAMNRFVRLPRPRENWHSIRRALITELFRAGVAEADIHRWMGWRRGQSTAYLYYHPDPIALDQAIYAVHPYLGAWRTLYGV